MSAQKLLLCIECDEISKEGDVCMECQIARADRDDPWAAERETFADRLQAARDYRTDMLIDEAKEARRKS